MPSQPIFRFAPSPNGYLHLGHAYSALFTQRAAEAGGGVALLRIEDIDIARCKPEYDRQILADMTWLGYDHPEPVMRQSQRFAEYEAAAQRLRTAELIYPCFCSRKDIIARSTLADPDDSPLYPGTCRHMSATEVAEHFAANVSVQWRLKMDEAQEEIGDVLVVRECPVDDRDVHFGDERPRAIEPGRWGDVVIIRKDTPTSYHLSVVVDDEAQAVTHVTRGMDLLASTDVHVLLQALLGFHSPVYAHHGLITDSLDSKLSKSAGAPALKLLREAGWTPVAVRKRLGFD